MSPSATLSINPAVSAAAALMVDGEVTEARLRDVAAMRGLPLFISAPLPAGLSSANLAADLLASAEAAVREEARAYRQACAALDEANRRTLPPIVRGARPTVLSPERVRARKAEAMREINRRRALLRAAERRLAALAH